jgi:hypothetical protein
VHFLRSYSVRHGRTSKIIPARRKEKNRRNHHNLHFSQDSTTSVRIDAGHFAAWLAERRSSCVD